MGKFYHYRCSLCGYEQEFRTGAGYFSLAHFDETDKQRASLEKELLAGKYGSVFQTLAETDELEYNCDTALYQCGTCRTLAVRRGKRVEYRYFKEKKPQGCKTFCLSAELDKRCTACGSEHMEQVDINTAICPQCKDRLLELINSGCWD